MMEITIDDDGTNGSSKRDSGSRDRGRDRDRHRRGDRPSRFQDRSPSNDRDRGNRRAPADRRVYISNIPYEFRWQDLKDLFRSEVGEVDYVELFADEGDKPRGCGIIEFSSPDSVKKAIEKMHRHEVRGRKLVVKEVTNDFDIERDCAGRLMSGGGGGGGGGRSSSNSRRDESSRNTRWQPHESPRSSSPNQKGWGFTYGLSPAFLESLGIKGPLVNRVFVANLDYKVDEKKLQEVFKLAGKVVSAELNKDKDGKSRGHGVVEYEHPVEAVQSISMLHHQMLFDRLLTVRMDRVNEKNESQPAKLPEGLRGIGMGLGEGGKALQDVSRSLPANLQNAQIQSMGIAALQNTAGIANIANQATLGGIAGMGNMQNLQHSVGMGFAGAAGGMAGLGGVMGSNIGNSLAGLGGAAGGLGMLGSSMAQGGGVGIGDISSSLGSSGLGMGNLSGGLSSSGMGAGLSNNSMFGNSNNNLGLGGTSLGGSNSYGSSGMNQMSSSYLSQQLGGSSSNYNVGSSNNSRNYDLPSSFNSMDDRDFRSSNFNNGQVKMETNKAPESDTVVVRNLAPSVTWQVLRDKFRDFGEVKYAEIRNKDTGLVRFTSARDAQRAADMMDRSRIDGRVVDVLLY